MLCLHKGADGKLKTDMNKLSKITLREIIEQDEILGKKELKNILGGKKVQELWCVLREGNFEYTSFCPKEYNSTDACTAWCYSAGWEYCFCF